MIYKASSKCFNWNLSNKQKKSTRTPKFNNKTLVPIIQEILIFSNNNLINKIIFLTKMVIQIYNNNKIRCKITSYKTIKAKVIQVITTLFNSKTKIIMISKLLRILSLLHLQIIY